MTSRVILSIVIHRVSSTNQIYHIADFGNYCCQMHPTELEIKNMTGSNTSASYLELLLSIRRDVQLRTSFYDTRDYFNFNFKTLRS